MRTFSTPTYTPPLTEDFNYMLTTMLKKHHSLIFYNTKGIIQHTDAKYYYNNSFQRIRTEITNIINNAKRYFSIYWNITKFEKMYCYILYLGILMDGFHMDYCQNMHMSIEHAIWNNQHPTPSEYQRFNYTPTDQVKLFLNKDDYNYNIAYNQYLTKLNDMSRDLFRKNCVINEDYGFVSNTIKNDKYEFIKPDFAENKSLF